VVSAQAAHPTPALVCRLYSEDRADARRNFGALEQIVRGMLLLVEGEARIKRITFRPVGRGISGSYWKAARSKEIGVRQKRTTLLQEIATELVRGHVVFFHVDGDCIWKEQKRAPVWGELDRFRRDLRAVAAHAQIGNLDESALKEAFLAVVPFYSIESWIYACTEQLRQRTNDPGELERIAEWAADLRKLDEVPKIKLALSIQDQCNHELAPHVPAARLRAARKSYADTVERVRKSARIKAGLAESLQRDW
jgi:hypothetical protein